MPASLLPADVAGYGFDNNADALTLSPALTGAYLGAAAKIGQMALGRPRGLPTPETFFVPSDSNQGLRISDDLPFGSRGGVALALLLSADGEYLFEMRPRETGVSGGFEGVTEEPHQLYCSLDKVQVWTGTIGGPSSRAPAAVVRGVVYDTADRDKKVADSLRFSIQVKAGLRLVQVYFAAKTFSYQEDLFDRSIHRESYRKPTVNRTFPLSRLRVPNWATTAVSDSPSRRKVLTCSPRLRASARVGTAGDDDDACCAKDDHLDTGTACLPRVRERRRSCRCSLASYRDGAKRGGFESGIEMAIRSILVSPDFPVPPRGSAGWRGAEYALSPD
jgi:hypothetical protein